MPDARVADVAVRCIDLSITRGMRTGEEVRVVDGVSFELAHGAALAVMGPTGAGKSSLAAVLAGSDEAGLAIDGGSAEVQGIDVRHPGRARRVHTYVTGHLPQSAGKHLPARLTVGEVIGEPITSRDRRVNERALAVRIAKLLDELMLPLGAADQYPYELSAGMRQRVALARALVLEPRLLIADDPLANLDVEVRRAVIDAIGRRQRDRGMSALVVTNEQVVARGLEADILVLRSGHMVATGSAATELLWTPGTEPDRRLLAG